MHEYLELMPCSYNEFKKETKLIEPTLSIEFGVALNMYRLAVERERKNREQQLPFEFE